jgi:putative polyhydroxyalkanoate system protein
VADIEVRRGHHLGIDRARRAADRLVADLGRKYGLHGDWRGDVLHFERPGVSGFLALEDSALHLSISLGLVLKTMKHSIERAVLDEVDRLFPAPAAAAEEAPKVKKAKGPPKKDG